MKIKKTLKNQKKKNKLKYEYILKIIKLVSLLLLICFHMFCNIYSKRLLNYYYTKRLEIIKKKGRQYNDSNIITFEDKINWICIHDVRKLKGKIADKILLHEYSKRILKKDICNKILKIYDDPYQIKISELPNQFVLKTNHGSGFNIIVHNKSKLNITLARENLSKWLKIDYGKKKAEFHYSFIN